MFGALPRVFGQYIVLDELAVGGMAKVYRAKPIDARLRSLVAVKRLGARAIGDEQLTNMFIDEARLAAQLVHPNIVQTYELGRDGDCLFMVMELVWGETVASLLNASRERGAPIPIDIACSIVLRAAEGLDAAHRARGLNGAPLNLVHRDVNPQNVMISYDGEVKLIDFGVAKSDHRLHRTTPGMIKGKLRYMAPEQIVSAHIDARADIFGLGLVLYELLAGHKAFDGGSPVEIFDKILNRDPPALPDTVPPFLREIVSKTIAKDAKNRFQSAGKLADALTPFVVRERGMIGTKEIGALINGVFPKAREVMQERQRRYAGVTLADCVNAADAPMTPPQPMIGSLSVTKPTQKPVPKPSPRPTPRGAKPVRLSTAKSEAVTRVLQRSDDDPLPRTVLADLADYLPRPAPATVMLAPEMLPREQRARRSSRSGLLIVGIVASLIFWLCMVASLYTPLGFGFFEQKATAASGPPTTVSLQAAVSNLEKQ